jgi:hypothetical protein
MRIARITSVRPADTLARNEREFSSSNDPIAQSERERLQ